MQPHVCAQPHIRVIVIDVKCYNIIQPQHVKCKQNGRWANYCAFILENTDRRKPKNRRKLCKVTGGFLCAPNSSAHFGFCCHFECVLLNMIVKLNCEVVLLSMVLDVFC